MPRVAGVSGRVERRRILLRPRPICVARWSADGRDLFVWYWPGGPVPATRVYVLPVWEGSRIPAIFASGPKSEEELAAMVPHITGARTIDRHGEGVGDIMPGPGPDVYAYQRGNTQRNLYRIPIR